MRGFESLTPDCDRSSAVERLNVTQVVAGSIPVGHPNFIHAPVAQQVDARDLGSRSFGSCRFESDPGYAGSSSPTEEASASNTDQVPVRIRGRVRRPVVSLARETGSKLNHNTCPDSSADRALDYGSRCRRFDSFSGHAERVEPLSLGSGGDTEPLAGGVCGLHSSLPNC